MSGESNDYCDVIDNEMVRKRRNNLELERTLRQQTERENEALRTQIRSINGYHRPPQFRQSTAVWDWDCSCGRLVFAGRRVCDKCGDPRSLGYTRVGSVRGMVQSTAAAAAASELQKRVPVSILEKQKVGGASGSAELAKPPSKSLVHGNKTTGTQSTALGGIGRGHALPNEKRDPPVPAQKADAAAGDEEAKIEADQKAAETEDENITQPEELEPKPLQQRLLNLERKRERKEKQLAANERDIAEQREEISRQQAKLVELQATADATAQEIREVDATRAELSRRLDQLNSQRAQCPTSQPADDAGDQSNPNMDSIKLGAMQLLEADRNGAPVDGSFVRQLLNLLLQMQPGPHAGAQSSPPIVTMVQPVAATVHAPAACGGTALAEDATTAIERFNIASPVSGDPNTADASGPVDMAVVGQCLGDKRKRDHVDDAERRANVENNPKEISDPPAKKAEAPAENQSADANDPIVWEHTPAAMPYVEFVPAPRGLTRDQLLEQLERKNQNQAERAKARAAASAAFRASPYT